MTLQKSALFNEYQQQALVALGLPLWQLSAGTRHAEAIEQFCYRIDNWLLLTAERFEPQHTSCCCHDVVMAITGLSGQSLNAVAEVTLTSVPNWPSSHLLDLRSMVNSSAELAAIKRSLWQQITHQFSA